MANLAPPPELSLAEWSDRFRILSPEASSEPGPWDTERVPYLRGIMDAFKDPLVEVLAWMASSQVSKTEFLNNVVGYTIDQDPGPILMIQPTLEMAHAWSKDRLAPMLRDSPCLHGKVSEPRSRNGDNTILHKSFPGGQLTVVGANSPASLASRPVKIVLADEVDRYEQSAGKEGDPVTLAMRRTLTFHDRKIVMTSTPTEWGISRIEAAYEESDQRDYYIPCPSCNKRQVLRFAGLKWPRDDKDKALPELAYYQCLYCPAKLTDADLREGVRIAAPDGWVAAKEFKGIAGFRINQLYSPWSTMSQIATEFLAATHSGNRERQKTFWNTFMGEVWRDSGEGVDISALLSRRESYTPKSIPAGVLVITAAVDVQDNRLEVEIKGWGHGEEGWGIEKLVLPGDPSLPQVWEDLDQILNKTYRTELGYDMPIATMAVDSGGHHTQQVYKWTRKHSKNFRRVWPVKGAGGSGRKLIGVPTVMRPSGVKLITLGVDEAKAEVYAQLKIAQVGPGYQHFPVENGYDRDHFEQLTSEERYLKHTQGIATFVWKKKKTSLRNEGLDLAVYNYCILAVLRPNWEALKAVQARKAEGAKPKIEPDDQDENAIGNTPNPRTPDPAPSEALPPRQSKLKARPRGARGGGWAGGW